MTNARIFTELTGRKWHFVSSYGEHYYECSCGERYGSYEAIGEHTKVSNPTYQNAADILNRMREFCGEDEVKHHSFMLNIGTYYSDRSLLKVVITYYIEETYILNAPALLQEAIEFLRSGK